MRILATIVLTALVLAAAGTIYIYSGSYNVAADVPHTAPGYWIVSTTLRNSVREHARGIVPPQLNDPQLVALGYQNFKDDCVACHGAPGVKPGEFTKGMRPQPPDLGEASKDWRAGELFWIIKHGIKMTGMPSWGVQHNDQQLWALVAFVERLPNISPAEYKSFDSMFARFGAQRSAK